ncbi:MAG: hypothetical protein AAF408_02430 [Pseudomonadota bacterium]
MSRLLVVPVALVCALLVWFWGSGGFDQLATWAAAEQRDFQNQIARALRALRGGQPGALVTLYTVCFAYGFFHAIGPGHGKILIGGYGLGRQVPRVRLVIISLISSLGQAVTAVALVYSGVLLFGVARDTLVGVTENIMAPISYGAIGLIGCWLAWRGLRKFRTYRANSRAPEAESHASENREVCASCGHRHGPSSAEIVAANSLREAVVLIVSIAARPCTGALFLLILTWQMGISTAGIGGAFAMALGTATVTVAVGLTSSGLRGGLLRSASAYRLTAVVIPSIELMAGLLIALVAGGLLLRAL